MEESLDVQSRLEILKEQNHQSNPNIYITRSRLHYQNTQHNKHLKRKRESTLTPKQYWVLELSTTQTIKSKHLIFSRLPIISSSNWRTIHLKKIRRIQNIIAKWSMVLHSRPQTNKINVRNNFNLQQLEATIFDRLNQQEKS